MPSVDIWAQKKREVNPSPRWDMTEAITIVSQIFEFIKYLPAFPKNNGPGDVKTAERDDTQSLPRHKYFFVIKERRWCGKYETMQNPCKSLLMCLKCESLPDALLTMSFEPRYMYVLRKFN